MSFMSCMRLGLRVVSALVFEHLSLKFEPLETLFVSSFPVETIRSNSQVLMYALKT